MKREEYCERVLAQLRRVTAAEQDAIRAELDAHIEDHICDLMELGYDEQLAEERTMARMGDPEEVGRELDKQYPLIWLLLSRFAAIALAFLVLVSLLGISALGRIHDNVRARTDPWSGVHESEAARVNLELDLRMEIGSDILRVMGSGTELSEDGPLAVVLFCQYDKNPLGCVTRGYAEPEYIDCRGESFRSGSGGGTRSGGAAYWRRSLPVQYGDPYVTMVYRRFGEEHTLTIPLQWEEGTT